MKKLMMGLLFLLGTSLFSLQSMAQTEVTTAQQEPAAGDLTELIAKAKSEGASWTADQWKDAFRQAMTTMAPMIKEVGALSKKAEAMSESSDMAALMKLQQEASAIQEKYSGLAQQMEEFEKLVEANEVGAKISQDEDFLQSILQALGLEGLMGN
ncbi:MAG: hypothetical protein IKX22_07720 [Prevotella sp.]|nr:hypothetical protein [Prevotella sp.]